jgi:hypothetical protein
MKKNPKHIFIILIFCFSVNSTYAQQFVESWDGAPNLERHQFTLNLIGPGFTYELGILKNLSLSGSFVPSYALYQHGYTFGYAFNTRARFYINFDSRYDKGKNINYNSADYIAAAQSMFWEPLQFFTNIDGPTENTLVFWGGVYGIQRSNDKGFNYNLEFGYGYYEGIGGIQSGHGPMLNLTIGWVATNRGRNKVTKLN